MNNLLLKFFWNFSHEISAGRQVSRISAMSLHYNYSLPHLAQGARFLISCVVNFWTRFQKYFGKTSELSKQGIVTLQMRRIRMSPTCTRQLLWDIDPFIDSPRGPPWSQRSLCVQVGDILTLLSWCVTIPKYLACVSELRLLASAFNCWIDTNL